MLDSYDDDPVTALTAALRLTVEAPGATWDELLVIAPFDPARAARLRAGEVGALDELFVELNELRVIGP